MEHLDSAENMEKVTALAGELKIAGYENARPEQKAEIARKKASMTSSTQTISLPESLPERSISFMPGEMSRKRGES